MLQSAFRFQARPATLQQLERPEWNLVSSQSFPHLWKNLWKLRVFSASAIQKGRFQGLSLRRKSADRGLKPFFGFLI